MPKTTVIFYADADGTAPALEWMAEQAPKVQDKLYATVQRLAELGHELRRPESAPLGSKIHELRVKHLRVNYRLLYFFHGNVAAVIAHGCTKEAAVDLADVARAAKRRQAFLADPQRHTCRA